MLQIKFWKIYDTTAEHDCLTKQISHTLVFSILKRAALSIKTSDSNGFIIIFLNYSC